MICFHYTTDSIKKRVMNDHLYVESAKFNSIIPFSTILFHLHFRNEQSILYSREKNDSKTGKRGNLVERGKEKEFHHT